MTFSLGMHTEDVPSLNLFLWKVADLSSLNRDDGDKERYKQII